MSKDVCPDCGIGWCPDGSYCVDCDAKRTKAALAELVAALDASDLRPWDELRQSCVCVCCGKRERDCGCELAKAMTRAEAALAQQ